MNDDSGDQSSQDAPNPVCPSTPWHESAAILSALIGGCRYGLKIRIPHALVMTFLFGGDMSLRKKLRVVAALAAEHATNLAAFAFSYKCMLAALKGMGSTLDAVNGPRFPRPSRSSPGLPREPYHAFLAGAVGGYMIWGRYSSVNYQLLLYLASRIVVACVKLMGEKGIWPWTSKRFKFPKVYPMAAAGIWGTVMMLYEGYPEVLHPSLKRSMDEIYRFSFSSLGGTGTDVAQI